MTAENTQHTYFLTFSRILCARLHMKTCFSTSNLFLIEIVRDKGGRNAAYPRPSGTLLPVAAGHVWRSPGMGGITEIPEKQQGERGQIQDLRCEITAWRNSLQLTLCHEQVTS